MTTNGGKDPVSEYNRILWNSGADEDKEQARKQKRKLTYIANIYVVKDPNNPQNEGQVFLYKFGKKIFDKITAAMQPEFEDEEAIDPFDFWQGANFKLKAKNVAGYRNYDSSEFAAPGALLDDDDAMETVWKKQFSLEEFTRPDQFKSYEELEKRMNAVLNPSQNTRRLDPDTFDEQEEVVMKSRQQMREEDEVVRKSPAAVELLPQQELDQLTRMMTHSRIFSVSPKSKIRKKEGIPCHGGAKADYIRRKYRKQFYGTRC